HLSASTPKIHVAAVSANHDLVEGRSVGKHDLFIRFLRGAWRLKPGCTASPLEICLWSLRPTSFGFCALSMKMAFLTALTSVKRAGNLQALSVNVSCLEFGPANSHVVLGTWPEYVPVVPTTLIEHVVTLQAIPSQEGDPNLSCFCPEIRRSQQLFKGNAVSKIGSPTGLWTQSKRSTKPEPLDQGCHCLSSFGKQGLSNRH
ncbi:hypothetical protein M9458_038025, partial [Cirrhinus mrigala]